MIEVKQTSLPGVLKIRPQKFDDDRGFFSETYNARLFANYGVGDVFVQDNHSFSAQAGVLRGLHYQLNPHAQAKLVRVTKGRVFDVAVDIRRNAPTYLQWVGIELSTDNWDQLYIPAGFAHGFLTLEDNCEFLYKVSDFYAPDCDRSIRFDDPDIAIDWPFDVNKLILSEKDKKAPFIRETEVFEWNGAGI